MVWYRRIGCTVQLRVNVLYCTLNTESRNGCPNLDVVLALDVRWKMYCAAQTSVLYSFPSHLAPRGCSLGLGLLFLEPLRI